jgi:hypothetical protein
MAASIAKVMGAALDEIEISSVRASGRRRISPEAGRALEILGHAIEYLADEYVHSGRAFSARDPEVQAVQILMALNRQIYFECPVVPTLADRLRAWLRILRG